MSLRIVFMGTPDFAVPTLMEVIGHGHEVAAVYTRPPQPAGRGMAERRSPDSYWPTVKRRIAPRGEFAVRFC